MQNILLLTDFSKNADNAITYAMQFFRGKTCEFYVLNVQKVSKYVTSDLITSPYKTVYDAVIKNPKKSVDILVNDLSKKYVKEDYSFEGICDYDSFISSVKQVISIKNIDLIVMGTNGVSGIKEAIFGSNTIQIIEKIDLPILVIPENFKFNKTERILFINEIDAVIDDISMKHLLYIIEKCNAQLDVFIIGNGSEQSKIENKKDNVISYFNNVQLNFIEEKDMPIESAIERIVEDNNIQLVAKIINTKSFFERIFSISTTSNITYASKVPLLFL